ncbi:TonB-dependent receptor [Mucilaginibacter limnophilus]|uniref:TonB-dependent receptor n=1 Tax=Mucilaginibacter limnophilus TaxID=1932778 RepID=A0A3S2WZ84_9SPHI|nr:TonB-dependent receptor [Mucilaginibacter limnophilus]RVU01640.1 TonB-dependent receptor [Mucilaginibacter limnophilus]
MKKIVVLFAALTCCIVARSQNTLNIIVKDAQTAALLPGATIQVQNTATAAVTDNAGFAQLINIPDGLQVIEFRYIGYITAIDTLTFPYTDTLLVQLSPSVEEELEEVRVTATRSSRTIASIPTRVEVLSAEELDEKGNMKPGDIRMLLAETTGIQTQQTSATSGNSSIRIQGMDGKYTQIIRDGMPLYSGFSGGLGLLQIAPLDLKQVEVIKGSSSTLYGGGAIAGLVNLVSKTPADKPQLNLLFNGTSALGLDASAFYSRKFTKTGITVYTAYNHGSPYDPADIDLTAIPLYDRFTLNPKLYFYFDDRTKLNFGINTTIENRIGGDLHYIKDGGGTQHSYFERNKTGRYSTQLQFDHNFNERNSITIKNTVGLYDRVITLPDYRFDGRQYNSYTEATYSSRGKISDWVAGVNFITDKFNEQRQSDFPLRDYNHVTVGGFVQNTLDISSKFTMETGLRADHHNEYGFFWLPRLSMLWHISPHLNSRLGGGLGYKAPNVFTEDAERIQFRNVLPVEASLVKAERSYGVNYDINYTTGLFDNLVSLSVNQLLFYTRINNPLLLTAVSNNQLQYLQPQGDLNTKGGETNIKLTYNNFKLFVGYTYADVTQHTGNVISEYPLVSKHRLNNVLFYEVEDKWKIGLEAYYFSRQRLNDNTIGRAYWIAGFMAEKIFERFSVFVNFENFTDTRQTKFGSIYTGSLMSPVFRDVYAPLDGFVVNAGIKLRLLN